MPRSAGFIDAYLLADGAQYVAGQQVRPGTYLDLESRRIVRLASPDRLPATCDGRVAIYVQQPEPWSAESVAARR